MDDPTKETLEEIMKKFFLVALSVMVMFAVLGCEDDPEDKNGGNGAKGPFTVTFDKNTIDVGSTPATNPTRLVTPPETTVQNLPTNPTRPGYIFQNWNTAADGSGTQFILTTPVTADITVYAQWLLGFTVTFNSNGGPAAVPPTMTVVSPATTVSTLPTLPPREFFEFIEWNTLANGEGTEFTDETPVTADIIVYAIWEFVGGTAVVVGNTVVHNRPLVEVTGNAVLTADGMVEVRGGGGLIYRFPEGEDFDIVEDYDYFIIDRTAATFGSGNPDTMFRRIGGANYVGPGTVALGNMNPWATNSDWLIRTVAGAGDSGGFQQTHGSSSFDITFNSITFHKAPRFTVTFDFDDDGVTPDEVVEDVWGIDANLNGWGVGAANWPEAPDRSGETPPLFFVGFFDADDVLYDDSSAIPGDITLTAKWTDDEPPKVAYITATTVSHGVYQFDIPDGTTWSEVKSITFKMLVDSPSIVSFFNTNANRLRAMVMSMGNPPPAPQANGVYAVNDGANSWAGLRIINHVDNASFNAVFGADYAVGTWRTFTWDFPATHAFLPAADFTDGSVLFSVGVGVNQNNGRDPFSYYMKDVALVLEEGGTIPAVELDDDNISWVWTMTGAGVDNPATRIFRYDTF